MRIRTVAVTGALIAGAVIGTAGPAMAQPGNEGAAPAANPLGKLPLLGDLTKSGLPVVGGLLPSGTGSAPGLIG